MKSIQYIVGGFILLFILQGCRQNELLEPQTDNSKEKEILPLSTRSGTGTLLEPTGLVYFQQDFNSSTDFNDYIGKGQHFFDAMRTNDDEYATINTLNNKLQIVKAGQGIDGTHRASVTRNTLIKDGPAKFLRFSMEVTVSNNTANVENGFMFSVGKIPSLAPAAPTKAQMNTLIRINPTKNDGEFIIQGGLNANTGFQDSAPLVGTQTVVWYVNNSGIPVGYTAPDGLPGSVQNNAADVWVIDEDGAMLALDEIPAVTPGVALEGFKISNNPNFTATLDVDDIVLSEEATVPVPSIVSVGLPRAIDVPLKTDFVLAPFDSEIEVTYDNGNKEMAKLSWAPGASGYNKYLLGTYEAEGTIVPNRGTINPDKHSVKTTITVRGELKLSNTFSPNGDGINDTWINPDLNNYRTLSIEVFDRDGVRLFYTTNPKIGWDGKNQHGQIVPGYYSYIIKVPDLGLQKKGVLTLVK